MTVQFLLGSPVRVLFGSPFSENSSKVEQPVEGGRMVVQVHLLRFFGRVG